MKKWYDPYPVITKNRAINMIVGGRRIGKTYSLKKALIKMALKNDTKIVFVRQKAVQLDEINDFFGDLKFDEEFKDLNIKDSKRYVYVNNKPLVLKVAVSGSSTLKSSGDYSDYNVIWFDEFLQENGDYLKFEAKKFMSLVVSVFRKDNPNNRVYMTSNTADYFNPYSEFFHFYPKSKEFTYDKKRNMLYQFVDMSEYVNDEENKSPFEKLVESTDYSDLALNNKFKDDNDNFVSKRSPESWELCGLELDGKRYGIWTDSATIWLTNYQSNNNVYSGDGENLSIPNFRTSQVGKEFRIFRMEGRIRFETRKLRSELLKIVL